MIYKCIDCGHVFSEGEETRSIESRGEYWGLPAVETLRGCPICRGSYEGASRCDICGSWQFEEELTSGVCEKCIEEYRYNLDECYAIAEGEMEQIAINYFLACMFTKEDIESILFDKLKEEQSKGPVDCERFINSDKNWFSEKIAEEVIKIENAKG